MSSEIIQLFQEEQISSIKEIVRVISQKMALPLFLIFWLADWIFAPQLAWYFLLLRLSIIPVILAISLMFKQPVSASKAQFLALILSSYFGLTISIMMMMTGGSTSLYYAGINLVAAGVALIPFTLGFTLLTLAIIVAPFFIMLGFSAYNLNSVSTSLLHSFFVFGNCVVVTVIRITINQIKMAELEARLGLKKEIQSRNLIIKDQAHEASRLKQLSRQFSPQVIQAMSTGTLRLDNKVNRQQICVCFIDIVNSTSRITRIDKDQMDAVISRFMDDTIQSLLQYDITIDKFLGDGIIAFSNAPMKKFNYVDNALLGALKVLEKIQQHRGFYLENWLQEFQVRIGLAAGYANVGFYGTAEAFKTYTAIGPVVNLAARLCSASKPNKILISSATKKLINDISSFHVLEAGALKLKGFEEDAIYGYYVDNAYDEKILPENIELCPQCEGLLVSKQDVKGNYYFYCNNCDESSSDEEFPPISISA